MLSPIKSSALIALLGSATLLAGCVTTNGRAPALPSAQEQQADITPTPDMQSGNTTAGISQPVKVAMLLPLSGKDAKLGAAMQNAAQLALTDLGYPNFELTFEDTKSSPDGAASAATAATKSGAKLLLGPILASEAKAAKTIAAQNNTNLITFSTDASVAGPNTFVIGILPHDQARQMAQFAASRGLHRVLIIAPRDAYGQIVTTAFISSAQRYNITVAGTVITDGNAGNLPAQLTHYFPAAGARADAPIDGVFMPLPVDAAARVSRMLKTIPGAEQITRMGTGLWDDANLTNNPDLVGAFYAAPTPQARERFEQVYKRNFAENPPRLASLGYDAAALAIMLGRAGGTNGYTASAISNPNGFTGIDGLFRFRTDGVAERGLAVIQMQPGARVIAAPSPQNFANMRY